MKICLFALFLKFQNLFNNMIDATSNPTSQLIKKKLVNTYQSLLPPSGLINFSNY